MKSEGYKKYTEQAKRAIKGEAFFESLVAEYSLPNQIVGLKDIGIDYICQWIYGNKPTWILYAVQVKTFSSKTARPKYIGTEKKGFNQLKKYEIRCANLIIEEKTLSYWQTLGMPVYLFAICDEGAKLNCYYKRFTPVLTQDNKDQSEMDFYRVNEGSSFIAFADSSRRIGGFARDLFIDYTRCNYYKGSVTYLNPRSIGLGQFPDGEYVIFEDLFQIYDHKIRCTYQQVKSFLDRYDKQKNLKEYKSK